jgi:hypothetical protein
MTGRMDYGFGVYFRSRNTLSCTSHLVIFDTKTVHYLPHPYALTFVFAFELCCKGIFKSILLPSGQEEPIFDGEGVPNDRLNIRMDHVRDEAKGAILSGGLMEYQITEMVKADPFGVGGTINVGDKIIAGTIDIRPVLGSVNDKEDEALMAKILQSISPDSASPAVN